MSKEKQVIHCENCFHAYNCPEGYNRSKCASFKDVNYKLYKQIEQLKAENENFIKTMLKRIEQITDSYEKEQFILLSILQSDLEELINENKNN